MIELTDASPAIKKEPVASPACEFMRVKQEPGGEGMTRDQPPEDASDDALVAPVAKRRITGKGRCHQKLEAAELESGMPSSHLPSPVWQCKLLTTQDILDHRSSPDEDMFAAPSACEGPGFYTHRAVLSTMERDDPVQSFAVPEERLLSGDALAEALADADVSLMPGGAQSHSSPTMPSLDVPTRLEIEQKPSPCTESCQHLHAVAWRQQQACLNRFGQL